MPHGRGGGSGRVRRRRRRAGGIVPAWKLLLSVVVSCFDRDVRRKKRSTHLAARASPTKWWDFRLPIPPPPPPPVDKCTDCGTTSTPQWRTGPMGPRTLCTNCGSRRRLAGERWGKPRSTWRGAARARASASVRARFFHDQLPPQVSPPVPASFPPSSSRVCEQGLAPAPDVFLETTSPNQVMPPPPATAVSDHRTPPQEILPAPASSPQSSRICEQGLAPTPNVLEVMTSPIRVTPPPPATESLPETAVSDHPPSPPPQPQEIPRVLFLPSPPSNRICEQGLVAPALNVLQGSTSSPNPVTPLAPAPATAPAGREQLPPPAAIASPAESSSASGTRRKRGKRRWRKGSACKHCGSTTTPQWRAGPDGRRTLCNACGVRYRQGRLLPEYRPKASPTFDGNVHANWHREVLHRRWRNRNNALPMTPAPPPPVTMTLPPPIPVVNVVSEPITPAPPVTMTLPLPPPLPVVNLAGESGINGPMEEQSLLGTFLLDGAAAPIPLLPPPSPPVVNLASEPRADDNEDELITNAAGTSGSSIDAMEELDPFLLDGPAAPMLFEEEEEEEPTLYNFFE